MWCQHPFFPGTESFEWEKRKRSKRVATATAAAQRSSPPASWADFLVLEPGAVLRAVCDTRFAYNTVTVPSRPPTAAFRLGESCCRFDCCFLVTYLLCCECVCFYYLSLLLLLLVFFFFFCYSPIFSQDRASRRWKGVSLLTHVVLFFSFSYSLHHWTFRHAYSKQ